MEYLFALLVLIWVLSQLFGQPSDEQTSQVPPEPSGRDRAGEERSQSVRDAIHEIEEQLQDGGQQPSEADGSHHWEQRKAGDQARSPSRGRQRRAAEKTPRQSTATGRQTGSSEGNQSKWRRSQVESPDVKDVTFENEISTPPSFEAPGSRPSRPSTTDKSDMQSRVRRRLESPEGIREAFLIKELIDRPRSQRPWPR